MAAIFVCDACGKQAPGTSNGLQWFKPDDWFERTPKGERTPLTACSRECVDRINDERGERTPIIPI